MIDLGFFKIENEQELYGGRWIGDLYMEQVDDFGRKSWLFSGRVMRLAGETWDEALDKRWD